MHQKDSSTGSKIVYLKTNMVSSNYVDLKSTSIDGLSHHQIQLSPPEIQIGASVGIQRQIREIQKNGNHILEKYISKNNDPGRHGLWGNAIEGALGEIAVAKALNQYHTGMESHWATDVGENIEVRTRRKEDHQLFLKPTDKPGFIYVLVVGQFGVYAIKGWIESDEVFSHPEWLHDFNGKTSKCYWVPDSELQPITNLVL
jgi:hypothetical protein